MGRCARGCRSTAGSSSAGELAGVLAVAAAGLGARRTCDGECQAGEILHALKGGRTDSGYAANLPPLRAEAEDLPIEVLYEDEAVIGINKRAGMVVHAGAGNHSGTLVNALLHRFEALSSTGGDLRPGIVHRLDKETSGVLVVARTDSAHRLLAEQFQSRTVEKIYLALVHGVVSVDTGTVDKPITRDPCGGPG